jgi:hypothetical protein
MSIAGRLGFPEAFQTTLLLLTLVLTLTPYFAGAMIGSVAIPRLSASRRRWMRFFGPFSLAVTVAVIVPLDVLRATTPDLRLLAADVSQSGDLDLVLTNPGTTAALVTAIELEVIGDRGLASRPILHSTAAYRISIDDLKVGNSRRLVVRHLIPTGATERFTISPETSRSLKVRVRIQTAHGAALSRDLEISAIATR